MQEDRIKSLIDTEIIGKKLSVYSDVDSTNDVLHSLAYENNEQDGTVIISDSQTKGRGRLSRNWFSPKGVNVYISILFRPKILVQNSPVFTFLASLALSETFDNYKVQSQIKWPNDILINNKKVAGVLTEMKSSNNLVEFIVVGIGVNLNLSKKEIKERLREVSNSTTSLFEELGKFIDREIFISELLKNLDDIYLIFKRQGIDYIVARWACRWGHLNERVKLDVDGKIIEGIARKVDNCGYLYVEKSNGNLEKIIAGDIIIES